jgi:lipopolysaccharide transport system permease protein
MSSVSETLPEPQVPLLEEPAAGPAPVDDLPVTVIETQPGWRSLNLRELWRNRELLYFLVWRDIKVRYKQTVLGVAWAVFKPLVTTVVFTLFFGLIARMRTEGGVDYSLFVLAGILPWTFFSTAVSSGSMSVLNNQHLVTKIYFPRLLIPTAEVASGLMDLAIGLVLLAGLLVCNGIYPGWGVLWAPLVLLLLTAAALGTATLLASLAVTYRDFRHLVPFLVQVWMFATPAIYLQGEGFFGRLGKDLLALNPAQGLILAFRQAVLGGQQDYATLAVSGAVSVVLLVAGCFYFRRVERTFADVI